MKSEKKILYGKCPTCKKDGVLLTLLGCADKRSHRCAPPNDNSNYELSENEKRQLNTWREKTGIGAIGCLIVSIIIMGIAIYLGSPLISYWLANISVILIACFALLLFTNLAALFSIKYNKHVREAIVTGVNMVLFVLTVIALIYSAQTLATTDNALRVATDTAGDTNFTLKMTIKSFETAQETDANIQKALFNSLNTKLDISFEMAHIVLDNNSLFIEKNKLWTNKFPEGFEVYASAMRIDDPVLVKDLIVLENLNSLINVDISNTLLNPRDINSKYVWQTELATIQKIPDLVCAMKKRLSKYGFEQPDWSLTDDTLGLVINRQYNCN